MIGLVGLWLSLAVQDSPAALLQQGLLDLRGGRFDQARAELEQAAHSQPSNPYVWVSLAEAYRRLKQTDQADQAAVKAEKFGGGQPAIEHALALFYTAEGQYARASKMDEHYRRALWLASKTDPEVAFQYAQFRLQKLDFSGAAEAVNDALAAHPQNAQLVLTMGVARYGQRRFEEAVDEFLQVIALDPAIPQPYEFLGRMLEQAGARLPEIRKAFEKYAASNSEDAEAQLLLAKVKLSEDARDATAEGLLRRSLALDAKNWEAHYELGVLLEAKRDFRGAADELKQASDLNGKEPMPHYHLARVYDRLGEPENAKQERQKHEELTAAGK